ncbi:MAG: ROK family transcriptional regulator [Edaphobacter sp.]|uniref:ROK family transcriptional regulator n=1 Tax=Edaphobacter sp. TaxID=1934404 RepID=UPI00238559A6|nr:ROK family transcriptional regulator [Edaphobacter sp.]MDE1175799.1 ROK family transcriptional regulator [Edaphobacter sp.]
MKKQVVAQGSSLSSPIERIRGVRRIDRTTASLATSDLAREINRDIVLEFIRFNQPVSRVNLARLSGLQPSTISAIVDSLLQEGWVKEGEIVRGSRGRPSTMVSISDDVAIFAIDLRPDRAIVAVIDLTGRLLAQETVPVGARPETAVKRLLLCIGRLRERFAAMRFEGVGISVPGRVDPATQRILMAPNLKWHNYDLKGALEEKLKLQVELDNDANACLASELWHGSLDGIGSAVLVAVGEGVGASIFSGGQLVYGFNGLAGEIGHVPIDPEGPRCGCGQRGCWEVFASSRTALERYRKMAPEEEIADIEELLTRAREGDKAAVKVLADQATALGRGLRLITAVLAPELILIAGELTSVWPMIEGRVRKELAARMLAGKPPRLTPAGDARSARLSGAAAILLHRHTYFHRSTHDGKALPAREASMAPRQ